MTLSAGVHFSSVRKGQFSAAAWMCSVISCCLAGQMANFRIRRFVLAENISVMMYLSCISGRSTFVTGAVQHTLVNFTLT